ncbi:MAG: HD domain-containing protein [Planctomycetota bacterium]|nr:HD domain-containing protein [Planctomycetota bacterium]MDA1213118.1 HD domain-containing protein [Planctomycetota bacterium]
MSGSRHPVLCEIERLFAEQGDSMYAGEPVTQTEHALQCAWAAEQANAAPSLMTAALLHDVGHLLHDNGEDCALEGIDDKHEYLGAKWLASYFDDAVRQPVRLHVAAKRYRCATDVTYYRQLSAASQLSLSLQGGPMSAEEVSSFREERYFNEAVQLRRWDEAAKIPKLTTPSLSHFLKIVELCVTKGLV